MATRVDRTYLGLFDASSFSRQNPGASSWGKSQMKVMTSWQPSGQLSKPQAMYRIPARSICAFYWSLFSRQDPEYGPVVLTCHCTSSMQDLPKERAMHRAHGLECHVPRSEGSFCGIPGTSFRLRFSEGDGTLTMCSLFTALLWGRHDENWLWTLWLVEFYKAFLCSAP